MNTQPTVVLLGGSGFIGRHLAADFAARGWQVVIQSRQPDAIRARLGSAYQYTPSMSALDPSLSPELVINLAGASVGDGRWTPARKQALIDSRLGPTRELAQWLRKTSVKPRLIIQASAIGYYGNGSSQGWQPVDENSPPQEIFVSQLCQQWEALGRQIQRDARIPVVITRLGVVLGQDGGILPQLLRPVSMCVGRIGSGAQPLTWVHMEDVIGAMRFFSAHLEDSAAKGDTSPAAAWQPTPDAGFQVFNLTAPEATTQLQFARTAARLMKRPLLLGVPAFVMKLALGEQAELVLDGQFVKPSRLLASRYEFRFPGLQEALKDLMKVRAG